MQRTLEDEENYENASVDIDLNVPYGDANNNPVEVKRAERNDQERAKATSATSAPRFDMNQIASSSDEASATEGHECDIRTEQEGQNTQEMEYTSGDPNAKGGFGSDIDAVAGIVPDGDPIGTENVEAIGTEREAHPTWTERDREPIGTEQEEDPVGAEREDLIGTEDDGEPVEADREDHIGTEQEGDPVGTEQGDQYGTERILESQVNPIGTEQGGDPVGTEQGDQCGTEQILETESLVNYTKRNMKVIDDSVAVQDTMELDDGGTHSQENANNFQSRISVQTVKDVGNTEGEIGDSIRTGDLLASEVAGSWACSTAPSVHGENESPKSRHENDDVSPSPNNLIGQVAESQSNPSCHIKQSREHQALTEMIGIIAPDLKKKFSGSVRYDSDRDGETQRSVSDSGGDSRTESDDGDGNNVKVVSDSDSETQGSNGADGADRQPQDPMDEDDEATQVDSLG